MTFLYFLGNPFEIQYGNAQIHKPDTADIDATPIAVVLTINEDKEGNVSFNPSEFSIKQGEEVLILNNATSNNHSFTNGENPEDPMTLKLFSYWYYKIWVKINYRENVSMTMDSIIEMIETDEEFRNFALDNYNVIIHCDNNDDKRIHVKKIWS